jgi:predicted  nucleic acid-binding Zn-ribbon protein
MLDRIKGGPSDDPWVQAGRMAEALARKLAARGSGADELPSLLSELAEAEEQARSLRDEVERHEGRLDDAAVHAGETLVRLRNAVAELGGNREQLVEGGVADEGMLEDLGLQIGALERRIAEAKAEQDSENRVIEKDLSPERDRLVAGELKRQMVTAQLIRRLFELKPDPCPPELQHDFSALEYLNESL